MTTTKKYSISVKSEIKDGALQGSVRANNEETLTFLRSLCTDEVTIVEFGHNRYERFRIFRYVMSALHHDAQLLLFTKDFLNDGVLEFNDTDMDFMNRLEVLADADRMKEFVTSVVKVGQKRTLTAEVLAPQGDDNETD